MTTVLLLRHGRTTANAAGVLAGWTPGVASRGYGRDESGTARWVEADTPVALGGDEPVLIAWKTGARVRVDSDRLAAARALVEAGCDIVVCDDGLQHYRLARDVEIEVVDGQRRYGNGRLLPAGPLHVHATAISVWSIWARPAQQRRHPRPMTPDSANGRCA